MLPEEFTIASVTTHPSGAFAITLANGYKVSGIITDTQVRVSDKIMTSYFYKDTGVLLDIDKQTGTLLPDPNEGKTRMISYGVGDKGRYRSPLVSPEQADVLNRFVAEIHDPIDHIQAKSRMIYDETVGTLELEPITSRHIKNKLQTLGLLLTFPISVPVLILLYRDLRFLLGPIHWTGSLWEMIAKGEVLKSDVVGARVVNREKLHRRSSPNKENPGVLISNFSDPSKWNPRRFGDSTSLTESHGCLKGNLEGIIMHTYSTNYYPSKDMGIADYSKGGYYMDVSPDLAQEIRIHPAIQDQVFSEYRATQKAFRGQVVSIIQESGLLEK